MIHDRLFMGERLLKRGKFIKKNCVEKCLHQCLPRSCIGFSITCTCRFVPFSCFLFSSRFSLNAFIFVVDGWLRVRLTLKCQNECSKYFQFDLERTNERTRRPRLPLLPIWPIQFLFIYCSIAFIQTAHQPANNGCKKLCHSINSS